MDGNQLPPQLTKNLSDPFSAGQLTGMLVILAFIEENKGISEHTLDRLKSVTADSLQEYFDRPSEDIHLMIKNLVKETR